MPRRIILKFNISNPVKFRTTDEQRRKYDNNKLFGAPDPSRGLSCVGSRGMSIFIKENNIVDTINISGIYMCDKSGWPIGLDSLVAFQDSLVNKYQR